jgi:hypothetical protein
MKTNLGTLFRIINFISFIFSTWALAQSPAAAIPGPVPAALGSAKTVFVSNAGADSGLFPHPFTGDPNRAYGEFYSNLKASGQFALVDDPSQADLVLELRLIAPYGPTGANKQNGTADPLPMFRLTVYDRKTHYALWTVTESIAVANLQKTHDRNFDDALDAVLAELLQVSGRQAH